MYKIGDQKIGEDSPAFVIAEAGSNHNGDLEKAKRLIDEAANAGADAVKFQTFKAEKVYVEGSGKAEYLEDERELREILKDMEMPYEWIGKLKKYADEKNIIFLSTPGFEEAADELEPYVPAFKVESFMMSHYPFLEYLIDKGKPIIISTGAHEMNEVREAVEFLKSNGFHDFSLLHCVSAYPTPLDRINTRVVKRFREEFGVSAGLSDHTLDPVTAPSSAVALGADVIEKHFTLDKTMDGPDHKFALEPHELKQMVKAIRNTEKAIGSEEKKVLDIEEELQNKTRKYIQAADNIKEGELINREKIQIISPGKKESGEKPKDLEKVLGRKANVDIQKGEGITFEKLEKE